MRPMPMGDYPHTDFDDSPQISKGYFHEATQVYIIQENHGLVKIGKTTDADRRLREIDYASPYPSRILCVLTTPQASVIEKEMHKLFDHRRVRGEWFDLNETEVEEAVKLLLQLHRKLT